MFFFVNGHCRYFVLWVVLDHSRKVTFVLCLKSNGVGYGVED